jgi:hypothetical protein
MIVDNLHAGVVNIQDDVTAMGKVNSTVGIAITTQVTTIPA